MLHIASIFDTRKMIIEAFCSVFDLLLDESFHNILKFCSINNVCFNLNHLHASIYTIEHHQYRSVSFLHTFLLSVWKTDNRDKNSSFFWKMYTQAGIDMRFVCYPQPPILTVYLYQRVSSTKNIFLIIFFFILNLSWKDAYFWTHFQIATCVLFLRGSNDLDASL